MAMATKALAEVVKVHAAKGIPSLLGISPQHRIHSLSQQQALPHGLHSIKKEKVHEAELMLLMLG